MREIKFRVYDKDLAKYLEGCERDSLMAELSAEGDDRVIVIEQICPARYAFEQYTGLKDKNGGEIYEGDLIKYDGIVYAVYWDNEASGFNTDRIDHLSQSHGADSLYKVIEYGSVVGNIHENKPGLPKIRKESNEAI